MIIETTPALHYQNVTPETQLTISNQIGVTQSNRYGTTQQEQVTHDHGGVIARYHRNVVYTRFTA